MYSKELTERIIKLLAPDNYTPREKSEARYPKRVLVDGAIVTRSAPSPTGFVHVGTISMSLINKLVALSSHGVNMLRIEDTDKRREIEHGVREIVQALEFFDLRPDEGVDDTRHSYGLYGPYMQSERADMYLGFAIELLQKGRAYPCFATAEELDKNYKDQQAAKVRPGYYGQWAMWRDRPEEDIIAALDAGTPFVLRFKSEGSHEKRLQVDDVLKGHLELPENDLDVPLIKSDEHRLPTYHLAHVVDDYLMQTTMILRGDEWLPSTPLHIELAQALDIKPFTYAHFAPISIMEGATKRKLSKRKDPEANVQYFIDAGYPAVAVLEYLVRLANSNFEDWRLENPTASIWDFPFSFEKWAKARGALLDIQKLDNVSKDIIANLPQDEYEAAVLAWANQHDKALHNALVADPVYTKKALAIEREGEQKRKDLAKWGDAPDQYGYFYDEIFKQRFASQIDELLKDLDQSVVAESRRIFLETYQFEDTQEEWFAKLKQSAEATGFATDHKAFKAEPEKYKGNLADFARIIRVSLTGKNRTPDLFTIMQVMGLERVDSRLNP
jgi:glutamyl-tRNA synthetase